MQAQTTGRLQGKEEASSRNKKRSATKEFDVSMNKGPRVAERIFRMLYELRTRRSEREKIVQYFPMGIDRCPRGRVERAPPKYCLLGELCLSRLSVCPIHFTSSVRIHLSRSHAAFLPIEVGLQHSCVPKRKCCLNAAAMPFSLRFVAGVRQDSLQYVRMEVA